MKATRSIIAMIAAFVIPLVYASECALFYGRYFNVRLDFIRPPIPFAPEDVLGLGFWLTWTLFLVAFVIACVVTSCIHKESRNYLAWASVVFIAVSVTDFALYARLEHLVLSL